MATKVLCVISNINDLRINHLTSIKGIGYNKASTILASIELGKRLNNKNKEIRRKLSSPDIIYEYYYEKLKGLKQEHFYAIYLDTKNKIIDEKLMFVGTINASIVHPREIFKESYLLSATSIICVHNHPSGNSLPSREDIEITKVLKSTGDILGIKLQDHIIIGENNYYSFYENKDFL